MNIIIVTHPSFLGGKKFNAFSSMPKYANLLYTGLQNLGHTVQLVAPKSFLFDLPFPTKIKGLLGYADQYLLFPQQLKRMARKAPADTLFVFTDHALGPWVPIVKGRPHIIHCHDFLAQRSALGEVEQNPLSRFGIKYQQYICKGYSQGKNFISISRKTQQELHRFVPIPQIALSEVVYNAIAEFWQPLERAAAAVILQKTMGDVLQKGFLLHVGGNQWYKNKAALVQLYSTWRSQSSTPLPLLLIGEAPDATLQAMIDTSPFAADIYIKTNVADEWVRAAYSMATLFVFPSIAEGFGWPIAEAMACGCQVAIINEEPMTEVAGNCAWLLPPYPTTNEAAVSKWLQQATTILSKAVNEPALERKARIACGLHNIKRFASEKVIGEVETIYKKVIAGEAY